MTPLCMEQPTTREAAFLALKAYAFLRYQLNCLSCGLPVPVTDEEHIERFCAENPRALSRGLIDDCYQGLLCHTREEAVIQFLTHCIQSLKDPYLNEQAQRTAGQVITACACPPAHTNPSPCIGAHQ